jgi:hypothetical protein
MADDSIAFDLLATVDTPVRSFRTGDVIFNEGDPAQDRTLFRKGKSKSGETAACSARSRKRRSSGRWR